MFKILFLLFLIVPIIEIFLLIEVGSKIGAFNTICLILLTAIAGTHLLRQQGLSTLARVQENLNHGRVPATELVEGLMLLVSGALLLTPGFFTDAVGFLCLVPAIRMRVANSLLQKLVILQQRQHGPDEQHDVIIEGEFWESEKKKENDYLP